MIKHLIMIAFYIAVLLFTSGTIVKFRMLDRIKYVENQLEITRAYMGYNEKLETLIDVSYDFRRSYILEHWKQYRNEINEISNATDSGDFFFNSDAYNELDTLIYAIDKINSLLRKPELNHKDSYKEHTALEQKSDNLRIHLLLKLHDLNNHFTGRYENLYSEISELTYRLQWLLVAVNSLILIYATLGILVIKKKLLIPLESIALGIKEYTDNNFSYQIDISSNSEISDIAGALNDMAKQIDVTMVHKSRLEKEFSHLSTYFNSSLVGMAETSLDKGWLRVNEKLCQILGYNEEELVRLTWSEITYPEDIEKDVTLFNEVVEGKRSGYTLEKRFIRKDGDIIYAFIAAEAVLDTEGNIDYFVALVQDITDQKKAELAVKESQQLLSAIAQTTPDIVYIFDLKQQYFEYLNKQMMDFLGYDEEDVQLLRGRLDTLMHPSDYIQYVKKIVPSYLQLKDGEVSEQTYRILNKSGIYTRMQTRVIIFSRDEKGIPTKILGTAHDVTASWQLQNELEKSEEKYRRLINLSRDMITLHDDNGICLFASPSIEELLGYTSEEVFGKLIYSFIHESDHKIVQKHIEKVCNWKIDGLIEFRVRKKDGSYIWVEALTSAVQSNTGVQLLTTTRDITNRKELEKNLRDSNRVLKKENRHLETYFNTSLLGMAETTLDKGCIKVNDKLCAITGYSRDELMSISWADITYAEDLEGDESLFKEVIAGIRDGYVIQKRFYHKDGTIVHALVSVEAVRKESGSIDYFVSLVQDMTELTKAQDEATKRQILFETLADASPDLLYVYSLEEQKNVYANKNIEEELGYDKNDLKNIDNVLVELLHPDDFQNYQTEIYPKYAKLKDKEILSHDLRVRDKDGIYQLWETRECILERDKEGTPLSIVGISRDVTERRKLENQLKSSEEHYRTLAEVSRDMISVHDEQGKYLYASPSFTTILGYDPKEIIGREAYDFFHPEDIEKIVKHHKLSLDQPEDRSLLSYRLRGKNNEYIWVETVNAVYNQQEDVRIMAVTRDVTDRIEIEEDLRRSNRELEQFAYVASHDLREPLRMVTSFTQLLQQRYSAELPAEAHEFMDFAVEGAKRMGSLIEDLLQLSRVTTTASLNENVSLALILNQVKRNLSLTMEEMHVTLEIEDVEENYLHGNSTHFVQLFQNLMQNAIKFSREGVPPKISIVCSVENNIQTIEFSDNGIGIDPRFITTIFDPFKRLHSRDKYEGNGIGLTVCRRIVEKYNGEITVTSELNKGTTFTLKFKNGRGGL